MSDSELHTEDSVEGGPLSELTVDRIALPVVVADLTSLIHAVQVREKAGQTRDEILAWAQEWTSSAPAEEIFEILKLVDVNAAGLRLWGVADLEEARARLPELVLPGAEHPILKKIENYLNGVHEYESDTQMRPLSSDEVIHTRTHCSLVNLGDRYYGVTAITNITDQVKLKLRHQRTEERQRVAMGATQLGIWEMNLPEGTVTFDESVPALIGHPGATLSSTPEVFRALLHPEDLLGFTQRLSELQTGERSSLEFLSRLRDAKEVSRFYRFHAEVASVDADGSPVRIIGTLLDVDAEITSQKLLTLEGEVLGKLASDRDLGEALKQLCLGIEAIWDQVKCAVNLHNPTQKTLHFGAGPSLPEMYNDLVEGFEIGSLPTVCGLALERGELSYIEDFADAPPEFEQSLPFYNELGVKACWSIPVPVGEEFLATCCVFTLVPRPPTALEKLQLERLARAAGLLIEADRQQRQRDQLEQRLHTNDRLESLGKLAGGIAHDFNNLLTVILSNAEMIALSSEDRVRECADQVRSAAGVAADLCRKMLTYAGEVPFQPKPLQLSAVVDEIVRIVRSGTPLRVEFQTDCPLTIPRMVGDQSMVSQLVLNLVTNAAEAIRGGGQVRVETGVCSLGERDVTNLFVGEGVEPGSHVFVRVSDTGEGISPEALGRIFDPFYSTKPEGRGLGLSTVFGAVRRLRGGIAVESTPEVGTTFTVFFPASLATSGETVSIAPTASGNPHRRIAIVDDEEAVRLSLAKLLQFHGYSAKSFAGGQEIVDELNDLEDCDAVLLDQQMPGIDGLETYRQLRSKFASLPICFMSGYATSEQVSTLVQTDAHCASLDKPFTTDALIATIKNLVGAEEATA